MAGGLAEHIILLLPDIAAPRLSKKTSVFFWKLFCSTLKKKALPARTVALKNGGLIRTTTICSGRTYFQPQHIVSLTEKMLFFSATRTAGTKQGGQAVLKNPLT